MGRVRSLRASAKPLERRYQWREYKFKTKEAMDLFRVLTEYREYTGYYRSQAISDGEHTYIIPIE